MSGVIAATAGVPTTSPLNAQSASILKFEENDIRSFYASAGIPHRYIMELIEHNVSKKEISEYKKTGVDMKYSIHFLLNNISATIFADFVSTVSKEEHEIVFSDFSDYPALLLKSFLSEKKFKQTEAFQILKVFRLSTSSQIDPNEVIGIWKKIQIKYGKDFKGTLKIFEDYLSNRITTEDILFCITNGILIDDLKKITITYPGFSLDQVLGIKKSGLDVDKTLSYLTEKKFKSGFFGYLNNQNIDHFKIIVNKLDGKAFFDEDKSELIRLVLDLKISDDYLDFVLKLTNELQTVIKIIKNKIPPDTIYKFQELFQVEDGQHLYTVIYLFENKISIENFHHLYGIYIKAGYSSELFWHVYHGTGYKNLKSLTLDVEALNKLSLVLLQLKQNNGLKSVSPYSLLEWIKAGDISIQDILVYSKIDLAPNVLLKLKRENNLDWILALAGNNKYFDFYAVAQALEIGLDRKEIEEILQRKISLVRVLYLKEKGRNWREYEQYNSLFKGLNQSQIDLILFLGIPIDEINKNITEENSRHFRVENIFDAFIQGLIEAKKIDQKKVQFIKEYNLSFLSSYPINVLENMYNNYHQSSKPKALYIFTKSDWNDAFQKNSHLYENVIKSRDIYVSEESADTAVIKRIQSFAEKNKDQEMRPFIVLGGHGSTDRIELSALPGEASYIDMSDGLKLSRIKHLTKGMTIVLQSCSTGRGQNNIAQLLADSLDVMVVAPDADTNISGFEFTESGEPIVFYHGANTRYFVPKK